MEEQKVKVVFEFDRKDYENVLFYLDEKIDEDCEKAWETMINEDIIVSKDMIANSFGLSRKDILVMFVTIALLRTKHGKAAK